MSDGNTSYGGTFTTASTDFTRGSSNGGVTTGGLYGFNTATVGSNRGIGIQPTGADMAPGSITLRLINNSGQTWSSIQLSYKIYTLNDEGRSTSIALSKSADNSSYLTEASATFTSPTTSSSPANWELTNRNLNLIGLSISPGASFYVRWSFSDAGGSGSRDEFTLDDIVINAAVAEASSIDSLRVMNWNILNFPDNNATPNRQDTLRKVFNYWKPDILLVNELNTSAGRTSILNMLNQHGNNKWSAAPWLTNTSSGTNEHQLVFYRNDKLTLAKSSVIQTDIRDIRRFKLFLNDPNLSSHLDTTFLELWAAHLKASDTPEDREIRRQEAKLMRIALDQFSSAPNLMVTGDLNLYNGNEPAYRTLLDSGTIRVYDPINQRGTWSNNNTFAAIHTQSPRTTSFNGGVIGGMDDRFDFMLPTLPIINGTKGIRYVSSTYRAMGNDGSRYNTNILGSTSDPDTVVRAIHNMSDHIPIVMKLVVDLPEPLPIFSLKARWLSPLQTIEAEILTDEPTHLDLMHSAGEQVHFSASSITALGSAVPQKVTLAIPKEWQGNGGSVKVRAVPIAGGNVKATYSNSLILSTKLNMPTKIIAYGDQVSLYSDTPLGSGCLEVWATSGQLVSREQLDLNDKTLHVQPLSVKNAGLYIIRWQGQHAVVQTKWQR